MRLMMMTLIMLVSGSAFAYNPCDKYAHNLHLREAIQIVAKHVRYDVDQMCSHPMILDIEAYEENVITKNGDVEGHVRVTLHRNEDSCYYKVRDADGAITSSRCYSTF